MKKLACALALSSALSILLLFFRIQWSGNIHYIFLSWNLFLAWIPFILALFLKEADKKKRSFLFTAPLFLSWLLFFPNCPYILTDLFHLRPKEGMPLWFDLVLILSFAWNGLLLGFASLFAVRDFLLHRWSETAVSLFTAFLMVLCSFGVYLGRYPRWNSWDIISNPVALFRDISGMVLHPMDHTKMVGVTFFFSLFLMASYWTLQSLVRHLKQEQYDG